MNTSATAPVCKVCDDTHKVHSETTGRSFACTNCPIPCNRCRQGGNGPYCETTPCHCSCHRKARGSHSERFPTTDLTSSEDVNACLRYALNELRAIDANEEKPRDRQTLPARLRALARHIELGGEAPDTMALLHEAIRIPIQA